MASEQLASCPRILRRYRRCHAVARIRSQPRDDCRCYGACFLRRESRRSGDEVGQANNDNGRITFTIHSDANPPDELLKAGMPENYRQEALSHFPHASSFSVDLPEGFKQQDTVFDHFGLMNALKPGKSMTIYFADLKYCGRTADLSHDPHWDASRNRGGYKAADAAGAHDFGFSNTSYAGGKPGEIGGTFWRSEATWGYYADKIGTLTFQDRLEAHGRVVMTAAGPDADMCFGWFRANNGETAPDKTGDFLGIHVGGPTRMGHPFVPAIRVTRRESR